MFKIAMLLWMLGGTVLAGVFMVAAMMVPSIAGQLKFYLPIAAVAGVVVALPFSFLFAKSILGAKIA